MVFDGECRNIFSGMDKAGNIVAWSLQLVTDGNFLYKVKATSLKICVGYMQWSSLNLQFTPKEYGKKRDIGKSVNDCVEGICVK